MLLVVTNRDDLTADYVIIELKRKGIDFFRLNVEEFPARLSLSLNPTDASGSQIRAGPLTLRFDQIRSVWYRRTAVPRLRPMEKKDREFVRTEAREALDWTWKILDAFWVSHPARIQGAEGKAHQLAFASESGIRVPRTLITNDPAAAQKFWTGIQTGVVAKSLRQKIVDRGRGRRIIFTTRLSETDKPFLKDVSISPVIFQEEIKKAYDVRVTAIGRRLFGTRIDSQRSASTQTDWRVADSRKIPHASLRLPPEIAEFCCRMLDHYVLQFGAFDFIVTPKGEWVFLELNPNGQWAWIEPLTKQPLRASMIRLLMEGEAA